MRLLILIAMFTTPHSSFGASVWKKTKKIDLVKESKKNIKRRPAKAYKARVKGNLPGYALLSNSAHKTISNVSKITDKSTYIMKRISLGDKFSITLGTVLNAVEGEKVPITGTILDGPLSGAMISGFTTLDTYSKAIALKFNRLSTPNDGEYDINALGVSGNSNLIKPTKYISTNTSNLFYYVLSAFGASFLESKVSINSSILGNIQNNDIKSSSYSASSEGANVVAQNFKKALDESRDVAIVSNSEEFSIKFLANPTSTIN